MNNPVRVTSLESGRSIHWMGSQGTFVATSATTAGAYGFWVDHPLGKGGSASHVHTREEEFFYVLAGEFSYYCAGKTFAAKPGAFVGLPKGLGHRFQNDGDSTAKLLIGLVPGGGEGFFLDLGNPIAEPNDASFPPDPQRSNEVAARYGQILLKPNLLGQHPDPQTGDMPLGIGRAPVCREPGEGDAYRVGGVYFTLKAVTAQTLGAYSVVEILLTPGSVLPAHRHSRYSEGLYVIEGELTIDAEGGPTQARSDSFVNIPPGAVHSLRNAADQPTRLLQLTTPGGIEDFYRAVGQPWHGRPGEPAGEPDSSSPDDPNRLTELGPLFGIDWT